MVDGNTILIERQNWEKNSIPLENKTTTNQNLKTSTTVNWFKGLYTYLKVKIMVQSTFK